jgi:Intein splicing domain
MTDTILERGHEVHPVIQMPDAGWMASQSEEMQARVWAVRRNAIEAMEYDPLRNGYEGSSWQRADKAVAEFRAKYPVGVLIFLVLGGHRAGKTEWRSKRSVQALFRNKDYKVWACQSTQEASRESQQVPMYKYLPPEYKSESGKLRRGRKLKVNYTPWGGFTEDVFAVENLFGTTSECRFKFYSMDAKSLEGAEINEGWCFIAGTKVLTPDGEVRVEEMLPGKYVTTRYGAKKVVGTKKRRANVGRVTFSNGSELVGTAEHLVLTSNYGWMRLGELEKGDQVCAINASNGMEECGISRPGATTIAERICTGRSTENTSERSPKGTTFTIETETYSTTPSRTSNAFHTPNTYEGMFLPTQEKRLIGYQSRFSKSNVLTVEYKSRGSAEHQSRFASPANSNAPNGLERNGAPQRVKFAEPHSIAGVEISVVSVASTWEDVGEEIVYNLTVEELPEYVANGIIVHNCDEEASLEWIEAIIYRLVSRNGILYLTFTPRWGYTQTVKAVLDGALTLEEGEADVELLAIRDPQGRILAAKKVPLVQENLSVNIPGHKVKGRICYFHTSENPYPLGNWDNMKETLRGASEDKILTTAYGVPTRSMMSQFPMFKDSVHVVSLNRFREIQKGGGAWYMFLDPCSGRNWFMQWIFVDTTNRAFVAGESPSFGHEGAYIPGVGDPGPWAVAGNKADGEMGDGQKERGWGYERYMEEIDRMERLLSGVGSERAATTHVGQHSDATPAQKISIAARWIDSRYGNARKTTEERSVTMIEELSDMGMDFLAAPTEKYIDGGRGGGDGSLRMINGKLFYDPARPIDVTNTPKLFVVETCPNTIFSLKEWTSRDGGHGACKDPIDCLRMFVLSGVEYVDESLMQPRTPWMNQFSR